MEKLTLIQFQICTKKKDSVKEAPDFIKQKTPEKLALLTALPKQHASRKWSQKHKMSRAAERKCSLKTLFSDFIKRDRTVVT